MTGSKALWCLLPLAIVLILPLSALGEESGNATNSRQAKVFSFFQVVRFQNGGCAGGSGKNGTCFTSDECKAKGGTNAGSCAGGYGVCCIFSIACGATSSQNCTYFESTGTETGSCVATICKASPNICQLRLDFQSFTISQPSTSTSTSVKTFNGQVNNQGGTSSTTATQCLTDMFSVTNPGGSAPPTICGTNTNQHMYVDASDACNSLAFLLGNAGTTTTRQWSIKVSQFACDFNNLAPSGCTQYFYGTTTGTVSTYNFGKEHLANQNQNICVRICWSATAITDVQVSAITMSASLLKSSKCCGYGATGKGTSGFDCLTIPGASTFANMANSPQRVCGTKKGLAGTMAAGSKTLCSKLTPFSIRFLSDNYETKAEVMGATAMNAKQTGARLAYAQTAC